MSNLGQKNPNLSVESTDGQKEGELEDIKVKYCSWYELKRKVDTREHVKQCRMRKVIRITKDQARHAYEVVILVDNVVQLKSLNAYKNHMKKIIAKVLGK
jgi:hypothetical protein